MEITSPISEQRSIGRGFLGFIFFVFTFFWIIAMIILPFTNSVNDLPPLQAVASSVYCPEGQTFSHYRMLNNSRMIKSNPVPFGCIDESGELTDVTSKVLPTSLAVGGLSFLIWRMILRRRKEDQPINADVTYRPTKAPPVIVTRPRQDLFTPQQINIHTTHGHFKPNNQSANDNPFANW